MHALVANVSAIETRFFSPPLTPRIMASPMGVFLAWRSPNMVTKVDVKVSENWERV